MTSTTDQLLRSNRGLGHEVSHVPASTSDLSEFGRWDLAQIPRQLGELRGVEPGPTLICVGGLHGNEPAGVLATQRVFTSLKGQEASFRGPFIGLVGNRQALAQGKRFLNHDLNRAWHPDRLAKLRVEGLLATDEDQEQLELDKILGRIIEEADGRLFLLDLHTTSGPGSAFAILDDTLPNREIALDFPVPLILGLEEELSGTLANHFTAFGVTVLGFEAGQHVDPRSIDRAEAAIWIALDSGGLLGGSLRERASEARRYLRQESDLGRRIFEVRHRHPIEPADGFRMKAGYRSFGAVEAGEKIGTSMQGEVEVPFGGRLLMPLYQDQGEDGYFLVREVRPMWLPVSSAVRRLGFERYLHLLPGVQRHPLRSDSFIVDRRYARWLARQLFHLLGFRREGRLDRILVMTRREDRDL
ncbi:MAG: succinylglutamate desuccinylase/aspartoacylase family protein [Acidobacteriota bacterium]